MLATIDAGGRVAVPKDARDRLGLRPGTRRTIESVALADLTPRRAFIVYPRSDCFSPTAGVEAIGIRNVVAELDTARRNTTHPTPLPDGQPSCGRVILPWVGSLHDCSTASA